MILKFVTSIICIMLICVIGEVNSAEFDIGIGGISSDKLSGNGGSKSVLSVSASTCAGFCYTGTAWRVIEQMDDDIGIVPEDGWSLQASTPGKWFVGARYDELYYLMMGLRLDGIEVALLVPSNNGRFGFMSRINTDGDAYGFMRYEYTGTQDPDTKDSLIIVGVGFKWI